MTRLGSVQGLSKLLETTVQIDNSRSKVKLSPNGADNSPLQVEENARVNIDVQHRLDTLSKTVDSVVAYLQSTTEPPFITELNGKQNFNPEIVNKLVEGLKALKAIRNVDTDLADILYKDIATAIIENSSINPWQEDMIAAVRKRMN